MDYNSNFIFSYNLAPFYCPVSNFIPISTPFLLIFSYRSPLLFSSTTPLPQVLQDVSTRNSGYSRYDEKESNEHADGDR